MGNSDSHEVTLEKDGEKFVQTADGIKLSPALVSKLSTKAESNRNAGDSPKNADDSAKLAHECQILLDEREKQMTALAEKFQSDLQKEKEKHQQFYELSLEEFQNAADEAEKKFRKPQLVPVCRTFQDDLIECYKNNPGRLLDCSEYMGRFKKCVNNAKESLLSKSHPAA
ncbi:MICOS complex subunit mic25-a [Ciona intestinalis]